MSRRVSAEELSLRWKLKHLLFDFFCNMWDEMRANLEEKGFSWRTKKFGKHYLEKKLQEHLKAENYVAVANYAFMLNDLQERKK